MPKSIAPDSTISTVWPHLSHQREYVSGVLRKMRQCNAESAQSAVRIGVTGTGQKPYYRIFTLGAPNDGDRLYGSFYDNHEPLEFGFAETNNWSTKSMSFEEVLNFYADANGYTGKRA